MRCERAHFEELRKSLLQHRRPASRKKSDASGDPPTVSNRQKVARLEIIVLVALFPSDDGDVPFETATEHRRAKAVHLFEEASIPFVLVRRNCEYPHRNLRMNRSCEQKSSHGAFAYVQICTSGDSTESVFQGAKCERVRPARRRQGCADLHLVPRRTDEGNRSNSQIAFEESGFSVISIETRVTVH